MKRKLLNIGASLLFLGMLGCTNPIGRVTDYLDNGSRKAKLSDYKSTEGVADFKKQVKVYDNFVVVEIGQYETEATCYLVQNGEYITYKVTRPATTYTYRDFNQDGNVDEYKFDDDICSSTIDIHSKVVWDEIYLPSVQSFSNTQKYANEELQRVINEDYDSLRKKGTRLEGKTYPPQGSWYESGAIP